MNALFFNKMMPTIYIVAITFIASMGKKRTLLCWLLFCCASIQSMAQQIKGVVQDRDSKVSLTGVQLLNIYNNTTAFTDSTGNFIISANKGELIEIRCAGYRTTRFRLSSGVIPPYFKLYLDKLVVLNPDQYASSTLSQYQIDSIKQHELYRTTLDYPRMTAMQQLESPFTAFSRSNQMKWAFQDSYAQFEREKFIDFSFNENLVSQLTGLSGEDLAAYMKHYRPSYQALRNMTQYDYYNYIKRTAERFKKLSKPSNVRNAG